jgi:hypothetical protein
VKDAPAPVSARWTAAAAAALAAMTQALYSRTLHSGLPPLDSAEFIEAIRVRGVAHPPGYPLLTLLGIAFSRLPLARPEALINYLSAFFGSVAVVLTLYLCLEVCGDLAASFAAAAALGVSMAFWPFAVVIEVVTLHYALLAAVLLLAVLYRRTGQPRLVWAMVFLFGLGLAHLHTILLMAPTLALLVLARRPRPAGARFWLACAACLAAGLLPYAYLPWAAARHPSLNTGDPESLGRLAEVFLRRPYGTLALSARSTAESARWKNTAAQMLSFGRALARDYKGAGALLALAGAWRLWRGDRVLALAFALHVALGLPVFLWLSNLPPTRFFRFVIVRLQGGRVMVFAVCLASGLAWLAGLARRRGVPRTLVWALAAALPAAMAVTNYKACDRSRFGHTERMARLVMSSVEPNAVVFSCYDTMSFSLRAVRDIYGVNPGVVLSSWNPYKTEAAQLREDLASLSLPPGDGVRFSRALIRRATPARPVYFTFANKCSGRDLLGSERSHLLPEGLVYRWVETPTHELYLRAAQKGLELLDSQPEVLLESAVDNPDAGVREVLRWYAESYLNLGLIFERLGRGDEAEDCRRKAAMILD